jgi:transcriptional regulator with XRE-family HTH domain
MNYIQEIFIQNLKRIRKEQGLTQAKLAEKCNVSNGTIGNIECGVTKPSFDLLILFSEVLHVEPADFFMKPSVSETKINLDTIEQNVQQAIMNTFEILKDTTHKFPQKKEV